MNGAKTAKLERAGWTLGTAKEFLGLTEEEAALIEIKLAPLYGCSYAPGELPWSASQRVSRSESLPAASPALLEVAFRPRTGTAPEAPIMASKEPAHISSCCRASGMFR